MNPDDTQGRVPLESRFEPFPITDTARSIPARFEAVARKHPDRVAVHTRGDQLSYREFDRRANRIARAITGARGDSPLPVAILAESDAAMLTAVFGALKAGAVFVILDAAHPAARAAQILEHAGAAVLVTQGGVADRARELAAGRIAILDLDSIGEVEDEGSPDVALSGDTPACIVYTSGSTGRPKGVLQSHANILHNILIHTNALRITPRDRLTLLSARSSGQAMTGIFSALVNGAALHPFDVRREGFAALARWLVEDRITIYHSSASVFRQLAQDLDPGTSFPDLRVVKLGSEPVSRRDLDLARRIFAREATFVNALSSTETGTMRQMLIAHDTPVPEAVVPVGDPVPDVDVLLLDEKGHPVTPGDVGTIWVRSRYLAIEYWRDPEATRAAFLPDRDGFRLYRTGDLGRLGPGGALEYLGRADLQVKIRGNRVELAEVEAAMREHADVGDACVNAQPDDRGTRLVGYVVPRPGTTLRPADLRAFLRKRLPAYMVPTGFVVLDAIPLTAAHKVDRAALPVWEPASLGGASLLPRQDFRIHQLLTIWEDILGVAGIDPGDDFFDLGGDSLQAVELVVRVEESFGRRVQIQDFMPSLTVGRMAQALAKDVTTFAEPIVTLRATGSKPPLVFAHGDFECGGFYCRNLARLLGEDRPFYVVHPHGLDGREMPPTIEAMAADRLAALRRVRPHGPYVVGGFCAGGSVALELARQLREQGETVDRVILIDARAENAPYRRRMQLLQSVCRTLVPWPRPRHRLYRRVRRFMGTLRETGGAGLAAQVAFVATKPFTALRALLRRRAKSSPVTAVPAVAVGKNLHVLWQAHHAALEEYIPQRYPGPLVLLRSTHLDDKSPRDEAAGWRDVAQSVEVFRIPGGHETCVTRHIDALAERIRACLEGSGVSAPIEYPRGK